jgi:CubicO group peptidase (beta-lactamase class C family)
MRSRILQALCLLAVLAASDVGAAPIAVQWGGWEDVPVPKDFDGDGRADYVVWRPSTGEWWSLSSATSHVRVEQWGTRGDVPVPADFTGDGRTDFVVWRPGNGVWYVKDGVTGAFVRSVQWGVSGDRPVPGDYTGDGRVDYAVWRPSTGVWWVLDGVTFATRAVQWVPGDVPVPGDYDGVRGDDFAVWRRGDGTWWTLGGVSNLIGTTYWGIAGDVPLSAKFCSDTASKTFWRQWDGGLFLTEGQVGWRLGQTNDIPVPANFFGDSVEEYAVYRPGNGYWFVEKSPCDRFAPLRTRISRSLVNVRGVTVAAVKDGRTVFSYGAGLANANFPATPTTPWQIASISKLFIGTALLALSDDGLINLDGPASIVNPYNNAAPTVRDFASHTSSVGSGCFSSGSWEPSANLALTTACLNDHRRFDNWRNRLPGAQAEYSNIGASWIARLLELRGGGAFDTFTRNRLFTPLGMTSTAWFWHQVGHLPLAEGYYANKTTPTYEYGVEPYPMGNLRASALDLAKFMIMWTSGGVAESGQRILDANTAARALSLHRSNSGFGFFWANGSVAGRSVWGHGGVLAGVCTRLNIDPAKRDGVVVLMNGPCQNVAGDLNAIEERAFQILAELE